MSAKRRDSVVSMAESVPASDTQSLVADELLPTRRRSTRLLALSRTTSTIDSLVSPQALSEASYPRVDSVGNIEQHLITDNSSQVSSQVSLNSQGDGFSKESASSSEAISQPGDSSASVWQLIKSDMYNGTDSLQDQFLHAEYVERVNSFAEIPFRLEQVCMPNDGLRFLPQPALSCAANTSVIITRLLW
jgi:hypothetical protein